LLDQGRILAEGNPAQVLTPDNLAQSFHIRVRIQNDDDGLQITPLACSRSP
jgi:ABC-type cobalamin transport system ATPase subunit